MTSNTYLSLLILGVAVVALLIGYCLGRSDGYWKRAEEERHRRVPP